MEYNFIEKICSWFRELAPSIEKITPFSRKWVCAWVYALVGNGGTVDTLQSYLGPLLVTWFNFNPAWIRNYIHYKVWDEIAYSFINFNGYTVEV